MRSDIEIAQSAEMSAISDIAAGIGLDEEDLELYGKFKAKLNLENTRKLPMKGKLVLVTAINPTPEGEGKTTTSVGLADALHLLGKKTMLCLREPSLGPVFGVKGGAAGGGFAQVIPMEDINLHFTGDFHAIGAANNLLAAMLDNHIYQGNSLGIDPCQITWRRCVDMNDRQLRNVVDGLGGLMSGTPREDGYDITVASEVMSVLCLAVDMDDLKSRLRRIIVGYTYTGEPVTAGDLKAEGAMSALLKDAIKPNLVQTLEHTPAIIHGGPFANIAHGCNSVTATTMAMRLADYVVTEAGFGADLGAEKFIDIKCRAAGIAPDAVVVVATVKALKYHGGADKNSYSEENLDALKRGLPNLLRHLRNITEVFGLPAVVAINKFTHDTSAELDMIKSACDEYSVKVAVSDVWTNGGEGGVELAEEVLAAIDSRDSNFRPLYGHHCPIKEKIQAVVRKIYGGDNVVFEQKAEKAIRKINEMGLGGLPVCMAKTQYSFSDDPLKLGAPDGFTVTVKNVKIAAGAGFIIVLTGNIMTMPGLPKIPAAEKIDVDSTGRISGLF